MNSRSKYKTKQRELLLDFFKSREGKHITAAEVCSFVKESGEAIGLSTVYRQLESLVDEGIINKYVIDAGTPACFEYSGHDSHEGHEGCFHCKCEKCGKLIHLHCDEMMEIQEHLSREHHFKLNPMRTVLYGLCEDCIEK